MTTCNASRRIATFAVVAFSACRSSTPIVAQARPEPIVAIEVWPERWATVADALAKIPEVGSKAGSSFWALAERATHAIGLEGLPLPPPGLDPKAPVSLELFGSSETFETTALATRRAILAGTPVDRAPSLWLRVTFQATAPGVLADTLRTSLTARGVSGRSAPVFRVVVGDSTVAVDVGVGGTSGPLGQAFPPHGGSAFLSGGASAVRALVHLDRLSELGTSPALADLVDALASEESSLRLLLFDDGLAEILTGYLLMDPATSFASEARLDLPSDRGQPLQLGLAMTDAGLTAMTAAGLTRGKTARLASLHWSDAIAAAERSPFLVDVLRGKSPAGNETELAHLFHQCGWSCFVYVAVPGNGFQFAQALPQTGLLDQLVADTGGPDLADLAATWSDGEWLFVHRSGATLPTTWRRSRTVGSNASEVCYRRALIAVRTALNAHGAKDASTSEALHAAAAALSGAAACVASDHVIASRHAAITQLVAAMSPN